MFQGGVALLGRARGTLVPPLRLVWQCSLPVKDPGRIEAGPLIIGNRVLLADTSGNVCCLDLATHQLVWNFVAPDAIFGTPLVTGGSGGGGAGGGRVFVGDQIGNLIALELATGNKLWQVDVGGPMHAAISGLPPLTSTGTELLLVPNDLGHLDARHPTDGKLVWQATLPSRINSAPAQAHGILYVGGCDSMLHALNAADGTERWSYALPGVVPGSPIVPENDSASAKVVAAKRIVVGTDQGELTCVDETGKLVWVYKDIGEHAMIFATPAAAQDVDHETTIIIGTRDHRVHGVDLATGKRRWVFDTAGEIDSPPLVSGAVVYVAGKDSRLYALATASGKELWRFNLQNSVAAPLAIGGAGGGTLIVADNTGTVYCFQEHR